MCHNEVSQVSHKYTNNQQEHRKIEATCAPMRHNRPRFSLFYLLFLNPKTLTCSSCSSCSSFDRCKQANEQLVAEFICVLYFVVCLCFSLCLLACLMHHQCFCFYREWNRRKLSLQLDRFGPSCVLTQRPQPWSCFFTCE